MPFSLIAFQVGRMLGRKIAASADRQPVRHSGEPVRRDARGLEQGAPMFGYEPPMTERLNLGQIALLITYAAGMAAGQLLFKAAALRLGDGYPLSTRALLLSQDAPFIGAIVLYAALSVLWVWLLTFTPLSRAYPFVAVAFALTPVLGALVFAEPLSARLLVGIAVDFVADDMTGRIRNPWVVVAAYNEAPVVGSVVSGIRRAGYAVVVVDDGSGDRTGDVALLAGAVVVRHPINLGQGAALQTGIDYALEQGADALVTFDADGQHSRRGHRGAARGARAARHRFRARQPLSQRRHRKSAGVAPPPAQRRALVHARSTTGLPVTDTHNGLRAMTARGARAISLRQNRMAHASEILHQIAHSGLRFVEVPVNIEYSAYSLARVNAHRCADDPDRSVCAEALPMIAQLLLTAFLAVGSALCLVGVSALAVIGLLAMRRALAGLYFVWVPAHATALAAFAGIGRGVDLILYIWVVISLLDVAQPASQAAAPDRDDHAAGARRSDRRAKGPA